MGLLSRKAETEISRKEITFLFPKTKGGQYEIGYGEKGKSNKKVNLTVKIFFIKCRGRKNHMCLKQTDHIISTLNLLPNITSTPLSLFNVIHTVMADTLILSILNCKKIQNETVYGFTHSTLKTDITFMPGL